VPFVRPVRVVPNGDVDTGTVAALLHVAPSVLRSTLYCVTALPPSVCGVLHVSAIVVEPGVAASDNGAEGDVVADVVPYVIVGVIGSPTDDVP
jgi:hypothetical protein